MGRFLANRCILLLLVLLLVGCDDGGNDSSASSQPTNNSVTLQETSGNSTPEQSTEPVTLQTASDDRVLEQRIKSELVKRYERQESRYLYYTQDAIAPPQQAAFNAKDSSSGGTPSYSTTNLQETGVDEGDLVKTDGSYLYLARGTHFIVLRAQPAATSSVVSDINLNDWINELYLENGRVEVVTASSRTTEALRTTGDVPQKATYNTPVTRLHVYDVADPASPKLTTRYEFPGTLQGSRRLGSTIYLVTNHRIDLPFPAYPWDYLRYGIFEQQAYERAAARAQSENLRMIAELTLADMIPTYTWTSYSGMTAGTSQTVDAVVPGDLYYPVTGNGTDLSLVFAVDMARRPDAIASSAVFTSWSTVYVSPESLYLASGNSWDWITPLATDSRELSNPEPSTAIHKFAIAASGGKPVYRGSGRVPGWLNNQFSMGEHDGFLRVGTTRGGWWGEQISNRLSILAELDGALEEVGRIDGIAPGERIYALRFDRERGYIVTFRQTDPLFTLDLSNPEKPRVAGEIHVSGFATYIHLIGDDNNLLLTIGRSADESGRVTGNKLQIFDVSNPTIPFLVDDFELGSDWSSALYDHHAFLYYRPLSLLAIPISGYSGTDFSYHSGLRLFSIDPADGFGERGSIRTSTIATPYGSYVDNVDRAVIINNNIYAIATESVTVAELDPLQVLTTVELPKIYRGYIVY